jgi:nitrite reductase/ring-hydroxylating ferredoxin subunit
MPGGEGQQARAPGQLVCDLIRAIFDGRTGDVLAVTHPGVVWRPVTRPGLSAYHGHAGTIRMVADLTAAYGLSQPEIIAVTEDRPGRVTVEARNVRRTSDGEIVTPLIACVFTLEDGLVTSMESSYTAGPPARVPGERAAPGGRKSPNDITVST